ncbi:MAG: hypothetical protein ACFB15_24485 [Cyclobacteriaceae bacterium]
MKHFSQSEKSTLRVCIISRPKQKIVNPFHLWHRNVEVLLAYRRILSSHYNLSLTFTSTLPQETNYDIIIVFSRFTAGITKQNRIAILKKLRPQCHRLLWFSERDSAGSTEFEVLPYVDRYLMRHKYRDLQDYSQTYYFNRKYTDYLAKKTNISHESFLANELLSSYEDHIHKIGLWWNLAYTILGSIPRWKRWMSVYLLNNTPRFPSKASELVKDMDLHALFVIKDQRGVINAQRDLALGKLQKLQQDYTITPIHRRVSKREYYAYMKRSRCVFSPFGWGEINYRDFEGFLLQACLLKPDMSDIDTWPLLYEENQTYVPLAWD